MRRRRDRVRSLSPNRARDRRHRRARSARRNRPRSRRDRRSDRHRERPRLRAIRRFRSIRSRATRGSARQDQASVARVRGITIHELVPSEARGQIACAAALCDHVGQRSQRGVACRMTADVVDRFQVIEIGDEERERHARRLGAREARLRAPFRMTTISRFASADR